MSERAKTWKTQPSRAFLKTTGNNHYKTVSNQALLLKGLCHMLHLCGLTVMSSLSLQEIAQEGCQAGV